jgi:hypothetical protein
MNRDVGVKRGEFLKFNFSKTIEILKSEIIKIKIS